MKFQGFVGPSYNLDSVNVDCQRAVNIYPELVESGTGKGGDRYAYVSTPGLREIISYGNDPIRLIHVDPNGTIFIVAGNQLKALYYNGTTWTAGTYGFLETTTGIVTAASGQLGSDTTTVFVDGTNSYVYFKNSAYPVGYFSKFADFGFPPVLGATHVTFIDGYFIYNTKNTNQFYVSDWNSFMVNPLSFASAEGDPDSIVAIISNNRDLILLNERSTETWTNTGNADFPFNRAGGGFIEKGCAAPYSVAKANGTVMWISRDASGQGMVYAADGLQPRRISTHAVEQAIAKYSHIEEATAYSYQSKGHFFYVLNFAENTWVYDLSEQMWHERCYTSGGEFYRHRANTHCYLPQFNLHLVGDYADGRVYVLDENYKLDGGAPITRMRVAPHVSADQKNVTYHSLEIDMKVGVGLDGNVQGSDPQIVLDWSKDGGYSWSNETPGSMGKKLGGIGEYKTRVVWRRLGCARDMVFRLKMTDPVDFVIAGAYLDLEVGAS